MRIILCLLFFFLVISSISFQSIMLMKREAYRIFWVQAAISVIAIIGGLFTILEVSTPSIAKLVLLLNPW